MVGLGESKKEAEVRAPLRVEGTLNKGAGPLRVEGTLNKGAGDFS